MRALFIEILVEILRHQGLGIHARCLQIFVDHVDDVLNRFATQLRDRNNLIQAYGELQEFVLRMVRAARAEGTPEIHERHHDSANNQCGLVFWCS